MTLNMSRIDRLYRDYTVTATLAGGGAATLSGVDIALLPPGTSPSAATTWTATTYADGRARVLLAGPDADQNGAIAVPAGGAFVWLRVVDNPEVDAELIDRIRIT